MSTDRSTYGSCRVGSSQIFFCKLRRVGLKFETAVYVLLGPKRITRVHLREIGLLNMCLGVHGAKMAVLGDKIGEGVVRY